MRRHFPRGLFGTEAELCEHFSAYARSVGYVVHGEIEDWDLLLIEPETRLQIGVQAKLRASVDVLAQALTSENGPGPDMHAVLVPIASWAFLHIAQELRVKVFEGGMITEDGGPKAPFTARQRLWSHPTKQWVPEVEIDVMAGVPAPRRVTKWKLAAVKLCLRIRDNGYVTTADFKELKLDRTWWFSHRFGPVLQTQSFDDANGWMRSKPGYYVFRDPNSPTNPDLKWPEIARALRAKQAQPRVRTKKSTSPTAV